MANYAVSMLRRGRRHDIECGRSTNRLRMAHDILAIHGATYDEAEGWPAWVTNEMLSHAYDMAHEMIVAKAAYNMRPRR